MSNQLLTVLAAMGITLLCLFVYKFIYRPASTELAAKQLEEFETECKECAEKVERSTDWHLSRLTPGQGIRVYVSLIRVDKTPNMEGYASMFPGADPDPFPGPVFETVYKEPVPTETRVAVWADVFIDHGKSANICCTERKVDHDRFGLAQKTDRIAELLRSKGFKALAAATCPPPLEHHLNCKFDYKLEATAAG